MRGVPTRRIETRQNAWKETDMERDTERFAVERSVYDRDWCYSDEGVAAARESLETRLDGGEDVSNVEVDDERLRLMEWDEEYVLGELHRFMDGERCEGSDYRNPYGGNEIIARISSRRWCGETSGFDTYRDLDDVFSWNGIFKDCELTSIRDVNGSLYIEGTHHDGGVLLEVRQLSDKGQKIWDELYGEKDWYFPYKGLDAMGKTYMYGDEFEFLRDLWDDETLCPRVGYLEKMYGNPAESYEHDGARVDVNRAEDGSAYEVTKAVGDGERCRVGNFGSLQEARAAVDEVARGWGRRAARAR